MSTDTADLFSWPALVDKHKVSERAFAKAYAVLSDQERSWIKKNIAQNHALFPATAWERTDCVTHWHSGLKTSVSTRPRDWLVLVPAGPLFGPARTVATLVPALTSGIKNILVLIPSRENPDPSLLVSLELCGLDMACSLNPESTAGLFARLALSPGQGVLLAPDVFLADMGLDGLPAAAVWRPAPPSRMGVWSEAAGQWDWQVLSWNHSGQTLEIWGRAPKNPAPGWKIRRGCWSSFLKQGYRAAGVPAHLAEAIPPGTCELILTPGQEGCWHWPDLPKDLFLSRRATLTQRGAAMDGPPGDSAGP